MESLRLALDLCRHVSGELDKIMQWDEQFGADCLAWSVPETKSFREVSMTSELLQADVSNDLAGNRTITKRGTESGQRKSFMITSHLDAVPEGGRYDGRAGILIGLAVLKMLDQENKKLPHDVLVQMNRGEESPRWGVAMLGAAMTTGRASLDDFQRVSMIKDDEGITLEKAMGPFVPDIDGLKSKVAAGEMLYPWHTVGHVLEPHIEQAPVLMHRGYHAGLATSIFGTMRANVRFVGEPGHTGSTPMDMRKDAGRALFELEKAFWDMEALYRDNRGDHSATFTVPVKEIINAANTTIPSDAFYRFEVRSANEKTLKGVHTELQERMRGIAQQYGVEIRNQPSVLYPGTRFDPVSAPVTDMSVEHIEIMEQHAADLGLKTLRMPSGAGHDIKHFHMIGIPSTLLFIPHGADSSLHPKGNFSHIPHEDMVVEPAADPFDLSSPFANAVRLAYKAATEFDALLLSEDERIPMLDQ